MKRIIAVLPLSLALACGRAPAAPTPLAGSPPGSLAIIYDASAIDSSINGSEAQLTGFDGVSLLPYISTKGSFTAVFDNDTVFRSANLNQYQPVDPCRQSAVDYNTAGAAGDASGLLAAISAISSRGCLAHLHGRQDRPPKPIAPIRSFRPLAAF